jgi:hypothetical protein
MNDTNHQPVEIDINNESNIDISMLAAASGDIRPWPPALASRFAKIVTPPRLIDVDELIRQSQQRQKEQKQLLDLMIQLKRNQKQPTKKVSRPRRFGKWFAV